MIRHLTSKDIDRVMDIWLKTTIKAHDFISEAYWYTNYDSVKNIYLPMSETFVYEDKEEIKGFISIINNELIGALFVDHRYQDCGIGKELINCAIDKYKELNLNVYKENKKAVQFYLNRGFEIIQEQINEDSGYSEYCMKKAFGNE